VAAAAAELKGGFLAQAVSQQPWDPSVKALTAFPAVLGSMDKNLSWTSAWATPPSTSSRR